MSRTMLALASLLTLSLGGQASAADLRAKPIYKAPPPPVVYSWTGCYLGAGGGYGTWIQDHSETLLGGPDSFNQTSGGKGWFGTAQVGCDYQLPGSSFVIGAFADYDWTSIKGDHGGSVVTFPFVGQEKMSSSWAVGGRLGWLPLERLMVFVSAGYTQSHFNAYTWSLNFAPGFTPDFYVNAANRKGWFVGTGYEYALGWFPGLTWKTEYRFADLGSATDIIYDFDNGLPFAQTNSHKYVQTVRSALVWRFGAR